MNLTFERRNPTLRIVSHDEGVSIDIDGGQWLVPFIAGVLMSEKISIKSISKDENPPFVGLSNWSCELDSTTLVGFDEVINIVEAALKPMVVKLSPEEGYGKFSRKYSVILH